MHKQKTQQYNYLSLQLFIRNRHWLFVVMLLIFITACKNNNKQVETLFTELPATETGISFTNKLTNTNEFNIYRYRNFYNGGGVAIGDVNNDGLPDIYLSANQQPNKLFINKGNLKFEDVTAKAGVAGKGSWSTGVSMIDINADGWMDIYVCNSGPVEGNKRKNEFFINNKDGTFTDKAAEMGLADTSYSIQAAFFDYDNDGDLDMYLLNNSPRSVETFNQEHNQRAIRDNSGGGDKLFRNDNGKFTDVSAKAGIFGSEIGFGLGIAVADLDRDGWMDIYVSNDFFERDYIYMNNHDGTFREELEKQMPSISGASMGSDVADINGDGFPEVFTTEMLPEKERRFKTTMTFENWDKYQFNVRNGYHHQFTRNMLQRNNGITSSEGISFSDVGRYAGVEATDWSWSVLIADLDNDGYKDLFITNGIAQDILDQDYLAYLGNEEVQRRVIKKEGVDYAKLIDIIPSTKIPNYAYAGNGDFNFENVTDKWGLASPSFSNGAAYADLDNDGDLDLVVNNVNMPLFVYRNNSEKQGNNYLKVELNGNKNNKDAIGAKLIVKAAGRSFYLDQEVVRGFESSIDKRANFGLGKIKKVDSLIVQWPYGEQTVLTNVPVNQTVKLNEADAVIPKMQHQTIAQSLFSETNIVDNSFSHKENSYNDFNKDPLIYNMYSTMGPKVAVADVNGDGLQDFYLGGAKGQPGMLCIQQKNGNFIKTNTSLFDKDKESEDIGSVFFDADNDGDMDLYVTSGGNETGINSFSYINRLYLNDGKGNFIKSPQQLPTSHPESTSVVKVCDFDGDGDMDLFVGVRLQPGLIGVPQNGYLLVNNGKGIFEDKTKELAPGLIKTGMIADAVWADYDGDGQKDLVIVGEWMNIKVFKNDHGHFTEKTIEAGLAETHGWWNSIEAKDLDGDGDIDFVCGNHGLNSRFHASLQKPIVCYVNDFDQNGTVEQVTCTYNGDSAYPFTLRHDLVAQLPYLKKKYLKYAAYSAQTIGDIFDAGIIKNAVVDKVTMLESVVLINNGNGTFDIKKLPMEAQLSPVYAICIADMDNDGINDIVLGGNLYEVKPEVGRYDASYGAYLKGTGNGNFVSVPTSQTGLMMKGQVRDIKPITIKGKQMLMVARNNDKPQFFFINNGKK